MIVVIEGADGTGKTTLARKFESRGFKYVHNGVPTPGTDLFKEYTQQLLEAQGAQHHTVFDRLHLGELVYGVHVRGNPGLTLEQLHLLNRLLFSNSGLLVICHTTDRLVEEKWRQRAGHEYVQETDTLRAINRHYGSLYRVMRGNNVVCHDYTYTYDAVSKLVALNNACPPGVLGSPAARFLFVGERPGSGEYDLAFYSTERSSSFLNNALWDAGYLENEMAFTNAITKTGEVRDLREIYDAYHNGIKVVALGKTADGVCNLDLVPHDTVSHPQYVRRFKLRQRDEYVQALAAVRHQEMI